MAKFSRRSALGLAGAGVAGIAGATAAARHFSAGGEAEQVSDAVAFTGVHQAGIVTPAQDRLHFATFDVTATTRAELVGLLRAWTAAAAQMTAGRDAGVTGALGGPPEAPPDDTGEALGLPPSQLSILKFSQMLISYLSTGAFYCRGGFQNMVNALADGNCC